MPLALPVAPTAHQRAAVGRLTAAYAAGAARFDESVVAGIAAIDTAVRDRQAALNSVAVGGFAAADAATTTARTRVQGVAAAQDAALVTEAGVQRAEVQAWQQTAVCEAASAVQGRQAQVGEAAMQRAEQVRADAAAAVAATSADAQAQSAAALAVGTGRAAATTADDQAVREAQAATARQLVGDTTEKISTGARDATQVMVNQGDEAAGGLGAMAVRVSGDLRSHLDPFVGQLGEQATRGAGAVDGALAQGRGGLGQQRDAALGAIDGTRSGAAQALRRDAASATAALAVEGQRAAEALRLAADQAIAELAAAMSQVLAEFAAQPVDEAGTAEFTEATEQQLMMTVDRFATGATTRADDVVRGTLGFQDEATAAFTATTDAAVARVTEQAGTGDAAMAQAGMGTGAAMESVVADTRTAGTAAAAQFGSVLDDHVGQVVPAMDELATQHRTAQGDRAAEVRAPMAEAGATLAGRIDTAQARAAERARRSWLSNQLADLWEAVTSPEFLVGLAVGLLVAAIIIGTAGTATPFVIMAASVAAGAAGAAAGTLTANVRAGKTGWALADNVFGNALIGALAGGVGAAVFLFGGGVLAGLELTGAALAVGGFVVLEASAIAANTIANVVAGQPWDKNLLTAMLLAPLIQRLAKLIPGRRPPGPLAEIDPNTPQVGEWTFRTTTSTLEDGTTVVRIEADLPHGRGFGHAERGYNRATGEFKAMQVDLSQVPREARVVQIANQQIPLNDYLTMRVMRILEVPVHQLRTVRVVEVQNVRAVLEIDQAVRSGVPINEAARASHAVRYNEAALTRAGAGRVVSATVQGGQRMPLSRLLEIWEGETPPPEMVARHDAILRDFNLTRADAANHTVLSDMDIVLTLAPAEPIVPVPQTGTDQDTRD